MNYDHIENLVRLSKNGDESSKEKLILEFRPFILNIAKKTFIHGYDFEDILNECYRILFKCISLYKLETHRFVAYATNGVKNSINYLIRTSIKNTHICDSSTLIFNNYDEEIYGLLDPNIENRLFEKHDHESLKYALNNLTDTELNLIDHIFFKGNTLKNYSLNNSISYSYAVKKKKHILDKLFMYINIYNHNLI